MLCALYLRNWTDPLEITFNVYARDLFLRSYAHDFLTEELKKKQSPESAETSWNTKFKMEPYGRNCCTSPPRRVVAAASAHVPQTVFSTPIQGVYFKFPHFVLKGQLVALNFSLFWCSCFSCYLSGNGETSSGGKPEEMRRLSDQNGIWSGKLWWVWWQFWTLAASSLTSAISVKGSRGSQVVKNAT